MKPGKEVTVTDPTSPHNGKSGKVVSTATTSEIAAVSVRINVDELAVWFFAHQLTPKTP